MCSAAKSVDGTRAEHHAAHREMPALRTELLDVLMLCQSRVVIDGQKIVLAEFWLACALWVATDRYLILMVWGDEMWTWKQPNTFLS